MEQKSMDQRVAEEENGNGAPSSPIRKPLKALQHPGVQTKLCKPIQKAPCCGQDPIAFAPFQGRDDGLSIPQKDAPDFFSGSLHFDILSPSFAKDTSSLQFLKPMLLIGD
jgi:hypothetical protein